jgi:hypothetical protein
MQARWIVLLAVVACGPNTPEEKAAVEIEEAKVEKEKREAYERAKRAERYYELEWVRCVNDLGIDRCKVIQETGFHQCENWEFKDERGIQKCAEHRLHDRAETLHVDEPLPLDDKARPVESLPAEDPAAPVSVEVPAPTSSETPLLGERTE